MTSVVEGVRVEALDEQNLAVQPEQLSMAQVAAQIGASGLMAKSGVEVSAARATHSSRLVWDGGVDPRSPLYVEPALSLSTNGEDAV